LYDVIIVGGGHNGLTCAAYLSRAGRRVLVLEANAELGGGTHHANGNFTAVRDEEALDRCRLGK